MKKLIPICLLLWFFSSAGCTYSLQLNQLDTPITPITIPIDPPEYKPAKIDFKMDISTSKGEKAFASGDILVSDHNDELLWDCNIETSGIQVFARWISKRNGDIVNHERPVFTGKQSLTAEQRKSFEEDFIKSIRQSTMKKLPDSSIKSDDVLYSINYSEDAIHYTGSHILKGWVIHNGIRCLYADFNISAKGKGITGSGHGYTIIDSQTFHVFYLEFLTTAGNYSIKVVYSADVNAL